MRMRIGSHGIILEDFPQKNEISRMRKSYQEEREAQPSFKNSMYEGLEAGEIWGNFTVTHW